MQLASHGVRASARDFTHVAPKLRGTPAARSIHIPAHQAVNTASVGKRLLSSARGFLTRAIVNLTKPGIGAHHVAAVSRSIHGGLPGRIPTIQQRMSSPLRFTFSRPLNAPYLPRGPTIPRSTTQVGLGTARNFSSGRVLFQNFHQNVPVIGRAICEANWDLHMEKERDNMKKSISGNKKKAHKKVAFQEKENKLSMPSKTTSMAKDVQVDELEHYFAALLTKAVSTALLIPLAPTPTSRMPLPPDTLPHNSLLPLQTLGSLHNAHELHALRVSALFSRLDSANVWDRGVKCSAYGTRADAQGVCTILKVEFEGWTKAEVRSVIGESGTGWCSLEEISLSPEEDDYLSDSSILSSPASEPATFSEPSQSLVLPTLDFSASFSQRIPSDDSLFFDIHSDFEVESMEDSSSPGDSGWMMFSSDFARRAEHIDFPETRESYF